MSIRTLEIELCSTSTRLEGIWRETRETRGDDTEGEEEEDDEEEDDEEEDDEGEDGYVTGTG